jgi:hypothetical protein
MKPKTGHGVPVPAAGASEQLMPAPLTDDQLAELLDTELSQHWLVRQTALPRSTRQLAMLRTDFPAWDIELDTETCRALKWTAVLRQELDARMRKAGIRERIECDSPYDLHRELSRQVTLIHNSRVPPAPH